MDDDRDRLSRLAKSLLGRLHSSAFDPSEDADLKEMLACVMERVSAEARSQICTDMIVGGTSEQRRRVLEAMVALGMLPSLVDWLLGRAELVTGGGWPMQDVLWICDRVCSSEDRERSGQLGKLVLGRVHAASFK